MYYRTIFHLNLVQVSTASPGPLNTSFINGCIRAFRFAGTAVDTFVCDYNRHSVLISLFNHFNNKKRSIMFPPFIEGAKVFQFV
jgi:hypothetical protein